MGTGRGRAALAALVLAFASCARAPEPEPARQPVVAVPETVYRDAAGRHYVVRSIERSAATPVGEGKVRTRHGIDLELERADDASWFYKYYLPDARPVPVTPVPMPEPPPAAEIETRATLRLEPAGAGLPQAGQWREGFDVADVDGDGRPDIVHGPARKGRRAPSVWLGDGRGGFAPWSAARYPALPYDYGDARAGDFDGDGRADLAFAVHLHGLLLLLGGGRGVFRAAGAGLDWADASAPFSSRAIRAVDLDRDGSLDLVALGEGPRLEGRGPSGPRNVLPGAEGVAVYGGRGDGTFARRAAASTAAAVFGTSLATADFDGDGRLDLATGSSQLGRSDLVQLARADGSFAPLAIATVRPRSYVRAVAAADFDSDGRADLALSYVSIATGSWWSGVDVLFAGDAPEWRRTALAARPDRNDFRSLAAGDLDGDGASDLVAVDAMGALAVFRGDGRGGFTAERELPPPFAGGCRGAHVAIADLDRDGRGDVIASFGQELPPGDPERCPSQGGLAAWRSVRHPSAR
jgi:hypothetical protein